MPILYLHGANMTEKSFVLFKRSIKGKSFCPEYYHTDGLENNISWIMDDTAKKFKGEEVDIVAHSMGGLIALSLLNTGLPIRKIVTMSTPFGGSVAASQLKWLYPNYPMFKDICSSNDFISEIKNMKIDIPMLSFVTTAGNSPLKYSENDGVVSVESQKAIDGTKYIDVELNHYEILLDETVVKKTKNFLS